MANWGSLPGRGNVEDRRSLGPAAGVGGLGLGGIALVVIFNLLTGGSTTDILNQLESVQVAPQSDVSRAEFAGEDDYEVFASRVLGSTDATWSDLFAQGGKSYARPKLVLFRQATQSACGGATSAVGPHYCPRDGTIYLDETFFDELTTRLGATGGDVAEAYVIAHEVGHHVQQQLGIMDEVRRLESAGDSRDASIDLELQADCFAGLWANSLKDQDVFQPGEINEAIDAAAAVGDDRIQQSVNGQVDPETWTHGSSEQRVTWFTRGYDSGTLDACNTFQ